MECLRRSPWLLLLALVALGRPVRAGAASEAPASPSTPSSATSSSTATRASTDSARELEAARAELAALATRIEALKREVAAGHAGRGELQPLLARSQELAARIEQLQPPRGVPAVAPAGPDAQELHERADALRDRADRIDRGLQQLEARIGELRRRARLEQSLQTVGGAGDVLADSAPRAAPSSRATAAAGTSGSVGTSAPSTSDSQGGATSGGSALPPASTTPPSTAPPPTPSVAPSPAADAAARALSVPPPREGDALAPRPDDSLQDLLRKRARLQAEVGTLRSQADALDADAVRTENVR